MSARAGSLITQMCKKQVLACRIHGESVDVMPLISCQTLLRLRPHFSQSVQRTESESEAGYLILCAT